MQICYFALTMIPKITLSLDTRRAKNDGTFPIVLRISYQQRTASIQTGFSVPKKDWDSKGRKVRKTFNGVSSVSRLNNKLLKLKVDASEKLQELEENDRLRDFNIKQIKDYLTKVESSSSFFVFTEELIKDFRKAQRFGNAQSYFTLLGVLKKFRQEQGKADLEFREVTYKFLKQFEHAHLAKGNSLNSLAVYMRTIRAIYNKGIKEGIIEREHYPFWEYKIQTEPTQKRAISIEELQKIVKVEVPQDRKLFDYRNYFLASYMMWGISFMDLAFLKLENITNDRIKYRRRKTSKLYDIKLSDQLNNILSYYTENKKPSDFIFPIIKRTQLEDQYKDVKWERKRYNAGLQELAELCGINQKLTSYVARHSFATQALLNEIPLKAISEMLGHSKLSTTEIYLKSLPSSVLDDYADRLKLE